MTRDACGPCVTCPAEKGMARELAAFLKEEGCGDIRHVNQQGRHALNLAVESKNIATVKVCLRRPMPACCLPLRTPLVPSHPNTPPARCARAAMPPRTSCHPNTPLHPDTLRARRPCHRAPHATPTPHSTQTRCARAGHATERPARLSPAGADRPRRLHGACARHDGIHGRAHGSGVRSPGHPQAPDPAPQGEQGGG